MRVRRFLGVGAVLALAAACGGSAFTSDKGQGGSDAGGSTANGGQSASGGKASGVGGAVSDGGSSGKATGGATNGGSTADGGSNDSGGTPAFGGTTDRGGSSGKGGSTSNGGKGGTTDRGGSNNSGGKGNSSGAANSGGKASTGGTAGTGGSDGICRSNEDCRISGDCCNCFAAAPGEATELCKLLCSQSACSAAGIKADEVACVAGRGGIARSCTPPLVFCDAVEPICPAGSIASVNGSCWGPCLQVGECSDVPSCKVCSDAGLTCVTDETQLGPRYHCVSTPPACEKNPTCSCMSVCRSPYTCTAPESTELSCTCPVC